MPHAYGLKAAEQRLVDDVTGIASNVLATHAAAIDDGGEFPTASIAALAERGLFGLCVPATHDGLGQAPRVFAAVVEELAQRCGSTAMIYVMHVAAAQAIASSSSLQERDGVLREIAAGRHLTTLAFSEQGSRSQFWAPVSRLEERNGAFVTSATKSWVTSAGHAHSYVSSAQRPGADSPLESTLYLVRTNRSGVRVTGSFRGLGLRGNDSAPVTLESYTVAQGDLVSPPGEGATMMLQVVLPWFNIGTAAMANGICRAAVTATADHLSGTGFEHTASRLRDLPVLRARLAQMSVRTEQSRALLGRTLLELENPSEATPLFVLQTRLAALQAAKAVTELGMEACGGAAFSRHLGLERIFRDAQAGWVMAPTVDHLNDFIGRALTGLPLF